MIQNPWKGLAPYREPSEGDEQTYLFCGREKASKELASLIKNSLFVTLYGRTGVGKTSLLEAGVFPRLRHSGYIPVPVRLSMGRATDSREAFARSITEAVELSVEEVRVCADAPSDPSEKDYLWAYFATRHFYTGGHEVFPVVVIDQFEENFSSDKAGTWRLLEQLHSLMDDNKIYPEGYHNETVFRIVLSIREDDLYRLEDCIDRLNLNDFKFNRYRLTGLTDEEAREVILFPGESILPPESSAREAVIKAIIKVVKDGNDGNINTLILSLVCSVLYDRVRERENGRITLEDVRNLGSNPLKDFYLSIARGLHKYRYYIEDRLVDADGRRNAVHKEEMSRNFPNWETLLTGSRRILQCSNDKVELIHDMLARAIYDVRLQRDNRRKSRLIQITILAFLAAAFIFAVFGTVYDISGRDQSRLQVFPKEGVVTDSSYFSDSHAEKLVWEGSGTLEVSHCPSLRHIVISNPATHIHINDCPGLTTVFFDCESVLSLSITDCPGIRNLNIPPQTGSINTYGSTRINSVIPPDGSEYQWLDGILWNTVHSKIVFISDSKSHKDGAYFPYGMREHRYYIYSVGDTLYNTGVWEDGLLFSADRTRIISSHNPLGRVLDLNRYPSLTHIESDAFLPGNGVRKLILKDGLSMFSSKSFNSLTELDTVVIPHKAPLVEIASSEKITYITSESGIYTKSGGIILKDGEAVWMSSEYPGNIYTEGSPEDYEGLTVLAPGFYCKVLDLNGNLTFNQGGGITGRAIADSIAAVSPVFRTEQYRGGTFFKIAGGNSYATVLSPAPQTLHIPPSIRVLDCSGIHSGTSRIIIESPDFDRFINLPDSLKHGISLYVPFGHQNTFMSVEEFKDFKSVNKTPLGATLTDNVFHICHLTYRFLADNPLCTLLTAVGLAATGALFYILSVNRYSRKFRDRRKILLKSITASLLMLLITLLSWAVTFWLIRFTFNSRTLWIGLTGASMSALTVLFSLHYSTLMEFRRLKAGHILLSAMKRTRTAAAAHGKTVMDALHRIFRRHRTTVICILAAVAATAAVGIFYSLCLSDSRQERRLLSSVQELASHKSIADKQLALETLAGYLYRDSSLNRKASPEAMKILRSLAYELNYDYICGVPCTFPENEGATFSRDSSVYARIADSRTVLVGSRTDEGSGHPVIFRKPVTDIDISLDGTMITAACGDMLNGYDIAVHNIRSRMTYSIYCGYPIEDICFSPDNRYIATGCSDGCTRIWDLSIRPVECVRKMQTGSYADIRHLRFSHDGKFLHICLSDGTMDVWSMDDEPDGDFILKACISHIRSRQQRH